MPGTDWIRVASNGIRRQDQRTQFLTDDGTLILMRYDAALIRGDEEFSRALASGRETTYAAQYIYMTPSSTSATTPTTGSRRACSSDAGG
jgi:hypothetical protein